VAVPQTGTLKVTVVVAAARRQLPARGAARALVSDDPVLKERAWVSVANASAICSKSSQSERRARSSAHG